MRKTENIKKMIPHKCVQGKTCTCYLSALEPDDNCPIHTGGTIPRCEVCGKFLKHPSTTIVVPSWPWIDEKAKHIYNHMMANPGTAYEVLRAALLEVHLNAEKSMIQFIPPEHITWIEE